MQKLPLMENWREKLAGYALEDIPPEGLLRYRYKKGEFLCHEGEWPESLLFITAGKSKIYITLENGKNLLLSFFVSEGMVGSVELLTGMNLTANVQALTETDCIAMPLATHTKLLVNHVPFLQCLSKELSIKVANSSRNSAMNVLHPLETRLCAYILMTHEDGWFSDTLTEVSELLGASYRHLLRTLGRLCTAGVLEKQKRGYRVLDQAALSRLAEDYYALQERTSYPAQGKRRNDS